MPNARLKAILVITSRPDIPEEGRDVDQTHRHDGPRHREAGLRLPCPIPAASRLAQLLQKIYSSRRGRAALGQRMRRHRDGQRDRSGLGPGPWRYAALTQAITQIPSPQPLASTCADTTARRSPGQSRSTSRRPQPAPRWLDIGVTATCRPQAGGADPRRRRISAAARRSQQRHLDRRRRENNALVSQRRRPRSSACARSCRRSTSCPPRFCSRRPSPR